MKHGLIFPVLMLALGLAACGGGGGGSDTQSPTVSLTASPSTVTAAGNVTLSASASDNVGVVKVEFYDGSTLLNTATSTPYTYNHAVTAAQNGSHSYTAKAYDAAGNVGVSAPQSVNVNIVTPLPGGVWDTSNWDAALFQ